MRLVLLAVCLAWSRLCVSQPIHSERCRFRPNEGLIPNEFTANKPDTYVNMGVVTDNAGSKGEKATITFDDELLIFSSNTKKAIEIHDDGFMFVEATGIKYTNVDGYNIDFDDTSQTYAFAAWVESDGDLEYRYSYRQLKRSDLVDNDKVQHTLFCELQMIEGMINGCDESRTSVDSARGEIQLDEVLVVTWKITDTNFIGGADYLFQAIIANGHDIDNSNRRETFIIYKYEDISDLLADFSLTELGYINGKYSNVVDREYAVICDDTDLHLRSNCRCKSALAGTYIFATRDNDGDDLVSPNVYLRNTCKLNTAAMTALCASTDPDDRRTYQNNCRPPRTPVDTCTEDIICYLGSDGSWTMQTVIYNTRDIHFPNTGYWFMDVTSLSSTPTRVSDTSCNGTILTSPDTDVYYFEKDIPDPDNPGCGMTSDGTELQFALYTYNLDELDIDMFSYDNSIIIHGTCKPGQLPPTIVSELTLSGIYSDTVARVTDRTVEAFFGLQKVYDKDVAGIKLGDGDEVEIGTIMYLQIGYDLGSANYDGKTVPYGFFVKDCWVSNDDQFRTQAGVYYTRMIIKDGCVNTDLLDSDDAFFPDDGFAESVRYSFANAGNGVYNFVQTSGAITAAWFAPGNSKAIHFRCSLEYCFNEDFYSSSKCKDSCNNDDIDFTGDYTTARKKRSADDSTMVQTYVNIVERRSESQQEEMCISNTAALSTLIALLVLLIMAVLITVLMFVKLQGRQKK